MKQLEGKAALITGAGRGIGKAISIGPAEQGTNLMPAARAMTDLEETQKAMMKHGVKAEIGRPLVYSIL